MRTYCRFYETEEEAFNAMRTYNRCLTKKNHKFIRAMVEGPENNWAVVDLGTAIEMGVGYEFA